MQRHSSASPSTIYNGAFAYTSPPERLFLSENQPVGDQVSPFTSKFNVLKFSSENKSSHKKKSKGGSSNKNSKGFKFKSNTSDKLMDLKVEE